MSKHERTVTEERQGGGDELSGQMESSCDSGFINGLPLDFNILIIVFVFSFISFSSKCKFS